MNDIITSFSGKTELSRPSIIFDVHDEPRPRLRAHLRHRLLLWAHKPMLDYLAILLQLQRQHQRRTAPPSALLPTRSTQGKRDAPVVVVVEIERAAGVLEHLRDGVAPARHELCFVLLAVVVVVLDNDDEPVLRLRLRARGRG